MPGKKNFFEKMTLLIPLEAKSVAEYYSLSHIDQEILADDCRIFMEAKLAALRAIPSTQGTGCCRVDSQLDSPWDPPVVTPHKTQLKSSYRPAQQPGIRRIGKIMGK